MSNIIWNVTSKIFFKFLLLTFPLLLQAKVYIDIGSAKAKKSVLAISPFVLKGEVVNESAVQTGKKLYSQLNRNLKFSGYFKILPFEAFIENPAKTDPLPYPQSVNGFRWENWKLSGADFLLFSNYQIAGNQIRLDVSLYDINLKKLYFKKVYLFPLAKSKRLIDQFSNDIVRKLSGRNGIFQTKIVSVRSTKGSKKELFVMDWNGANKRRLTYHKSVIVSPLWSPKGDYIAYTAFLFNKRLNSRVATLLLLHLESNTAQILLQRASGSLGADFFPNGREMLVTLPHGSGFMNIFRFSLGTKKLKALTHGPLGTINVEPRIHPKTKRIAFSSDRTGKPMIYTMSKKGGNMIQLTYAGHYNTSPDWSPIRRELVFSGQSNGRFDIFLIKEWGRGLKRLTTLRKKTGGWANFESPSFSPDGRFLVFTSDLTGNDQLYIMNLDDLLIERITFDSFNYQSPRWSPYL